MISVVEEEGLEHQLFSGCRKQLELMQMQMLTVIGLAFTLRTGAAANGR
jgi:hypothetical protein